MLGALLPMSSASDGSGRGRAEGGGWTLEQVAGVVPRPGMTGDGRLLPTPRAGNGERTGDRIYRREPGKPRNLEHALGDALLPTPVHNDDHVLRHRGGTPSLAGAVGAEYADGRRFESGLLLPTPIAHDSTGKATQYGDNPMLLGAAAEPNRTSWRRKSAVQVDGVLQLPMFELDEIPAGMSDVVDGADHPMGVYGPAVDRWAAVVGRPAPEATYRDPADGRIKLNPWFSEWMMGLPRDWVAGLLPPRKALRCCGNGVVPQQGALAISALVRAGVDDGSGEDRSG